MNYTIYYTTKDINSIPINPKASVLNMNCCRAPGLGSSTVDQVLKYTKYPKYIPSTSTGQVLIFFKST